MNNPKLEALVKSGTISSYQLRTRDMDGAVVDNPGDGSRETGEVELTFPSGEVLVIGTFCSGSAENTVLLFDNIRNELY